MPERIFIYFVSKKRKSHNRNSPKSTVRQTRIFAYTHWEKKTEAKNSHRIISSYSSFVKHWMKRKLKKKNKERETSARLNLVRIYLNKKEVDEPKHGPTTTNTYAIHSFFRLSIRTKWNCKQKKFAWIHLFPRQAKKDRSSRHSRRLWQRQPYPHTHASRKQSKFAHKTKTWIEAAAAAAYKCRQLLTPLLMSDGLHWVYYHLIRTTTKYSITWTPQKT